MSLSLLGFDYQWPREHSNDRTIVMIVMSITVTYTNKRVTITKYVQGSDQEGACVLYLTVEHDGHLKCTCDVFKVATTEGAQVIRSARPRVTSH